MKSPAPDRDNFPRDDVPKDALLQDEALQHAGLISEVLGGGAAAYRVLYDLHMPRIYTFFYWNVKTAAKAEELTQDVFVRAWEKLGQFRFSSSFSTWLFRIAVNMLKSDYRSRGRDRTGSLAEEETGGGACESGGIPAAEVMDLRRAIGLLPEKAGMVLTLYEFENYSHQEIGEILHISAGTSKAHLHRAKKLLKKELES